MGRGRSSWGAAVLKPIICGAFFCLVGGNWSSFAQGPTQQLFWEYDGSKFYLVAQGRSRKFHYKEPRSELLNAGVKPNTIIFEGEVVGDQYRGVAYILNGHCGKIPYQVHGPILDNYRRVELRGQAPRIDNNCRVTGYVDDLLAFQLVEPASGGTEAQKQSALAAVNYDGKNTATLRYKDLIVTVDRELFEGSDRIPVATGRYGANTVFSLKGGQNGREEPTAVVSVMQLDPATAQPQVILEYFWGGAHCCTVTQIATVDASGKWNVVDGGVLDGEGYQLKTFDPDGSNALISVDNSFYYTFDCYACSYAPTRIQKLVGLKLRDVTRSALYQNYLRQQVSIR